MALDKSFNEFTTVFNSLLNLINSYCNTVFIDSKYLTGCSFLALSVSKRGGNFFNNTYIFSCIISSGFYPFPPDSLGNNPKIVSQIKLVSIIAEVIAALECSPNTSVVSKRGNSYINYLVSSNNPGAGA